MKDHVGMEVNSSSEHKKFFNTVNKSDEWLKGLEDLGNKEIGFLGKKDTADGKQWTCFVDWRHRSVSSQGLCERETHQHKKN